MTNIADLKHLQGDSLRARVQRFGGNLAAMIMPNIGAFIAWGLITALFIPTGWLPNETLAQLVDPMITMLLPLLIGYTGGRLVHGQRGAVVGAVATVGVVVGSEVPMFLGAMVIGPLAALAVKGFDRLVDGRIRTGFEMLVNNFSAGIIGGAMALLGLVAIGPVVEALTTAAGEGVEFLVSNSLLPLVSVIVEPAKVLFLNNAINHGVLSPLGLSQAAEAGQSVLFMIETNPGPGLGILIAFLLFGPRLSRATVPGAMIIHFLGGIHEIYFPYVLMKPRLILAAIGGGAAGVATAMITNAGLVAVPSPGSIFAYLAVTPRGGYVSVLLSIAVATGVSFLLASMLLRFGRGADEAITSPPVTAGSTAAPAKVAAGTRAEQPPSPRAVISGKDVSTVLIACDAGMGSSVMLAGQLRGRLEPHGVRVEHVSVGEIPADAQLVLTHIDLADRARATAPNAVVVEFTSFLSDPAFDAVTEAIKEGGELRG
ncbi:PTS system, mannitol-specific IIC component [Saccharomonospora marina XMU15]|uniref:PTS system mannitol-specific EIICB component n=1 Tax=Saccharomonospora marina XMU15 TaxID=882083 RepID=H5WXW8_9PSEU|nr:PTS mannitol transporter subunit IICB [Saccharomonospora marina]EHR51777.1 PTS system, mannitol-specific IIC component [Saccharomonospora marina XMU15]